VAGLLFDDAIEAVLFGLWPVVGAWIVGGVVIVLTRGRAGGRGLEALDAKLALGIGLAQCLALWPGTSRSLATILGATLLGLSLPAAVEFSFLLGLLTLGAATGYSALKHGDALVEAYSPAALLVGFLAAAGSAAVAVRWLVGWIQQRGMGVFAVWRIGLAAVVAALLTSGLLKGGTPPDAERAVTVPAPGTTSAHE
jgi:undecaprenyl-diphosphatase